MDSAGQSLSSQASHLLQTCTSTHLSTPTPANICFSSPSLFSLALLLSAIHSIPSTPLSRHPILPNRHLLFLTREKKGRTTITHSHPIPYWAPSTIPPPTNPGPASAAAVQFLSDSHRNRTGSGQDQVQTTRDLELESCRQDQLGLNRHKRGIETPPLYTSTSHKAETPFPLQPICTSDTISPPHNWNSSTRRRGIFQFPPTSIPSHRQDDCEVPAFRPSPCLLDPLNSP